jgi:magnesium-transporting ATPase (P-type)
LQGGDGIVTGTELQDLQNGDLDARLNGVSVVARVTPLDKLRIVESLQRQGHVVAMTGDGVNDAPALRLADVGVAMGASGTEVARQAADVVLSDDDFATLVEALVEGRSFWQNIRRALGVLLGGNLGELGLVVGASALGLSSPLVTRQILAVNLITDALPALAITLQRPPHQNLAALAREGASALDAPLRNDVIRRGIIAALPSLATYGIALRARGLLEARSVAFAGIVSAQLGQTLLAGWSLGGLSKPVAAAVAGSMAVLGASISIPALRELLQLGTLGPLGWSLIGASTLFGLLAGWLTNDYYDAALEKPILHLLPARPSLAVS